MALEGNTSEASVGPGVGVTNGNQAGAATTNGTYNTVTLTGGGTAVYDNTNPHTGRMAYKLSGPSGYVAILQRSGFSVTTLRLKFAVALGAIPAVLFNVLAVRNSTGAAFSIRANPASTFSLHDRLGALKKTVTMPASMTYMVLDIVLTPGASSTTGRIAVNFYTDAGGLVDSYDVSTNDIGTTALTIFQLGHSAAADTTDVYIDDMAYDTASTPTTFIGQGNIKTTMSSATSWAVRTAVTTTLSTSWSDRQAVTKTANTSWAVRGNVVKTVSTQWAVRGLATKTVNTSWAVRSSALKSSATTWAVRARVSKTSVTAWSVRSRLTKSSATSWAVRVRVTVTSPTSWNVSGTLAHVVMTQATSWAIRMAVGRSSSTTWAVRSRAIKSSSTSWAVRTRQTRTAPTSWAVRTRVSKTSSTSWAIRLALVITVATLWAVRQRVTRTAVTPWNIQSDQLTRVLTVSGWLGENPLRGSLGDNRLTGSLGANRWKGSLWHS